MYVILLLIEELEVLDLKNVVVLYVELFIYFEGIVKVVFVYGCMKNDEKDVIM